MAFTLDLLPFVVILSYMQAAAPSRGEVRTEEYVVLALVILLSALPDGSASSHGKRLQISSDRDSFAYVTTDGTEVLLPTTRPYDTKFQPSPRDRWAYLKEHGRVGVPVATAAGAYVDYARSSTDTILDGSLEGIAIVLAGLLACGIYKAFQRERCPYCKKKHKNTTKVCPNTDMMLWFFDEQQPSSKYDRPELSSREEITQFICKAYYPITRTQAESLADQIFDKEQGPFEKKEFKDYLRIKDYEALILDQRLLRST